MSELKDFYKMLREENEKRYGTDIDSYGPTLLNDLYSDRTHFIYEILQNTEDACERFLKSEEKKNFYIKFDLFDDRLEVRHNGIPFTKDDVRGICALASGTKTEDEDQIGKFGIGFKSVYAYSNSPQIHSEDKHFVIKNYVHPEELNFEGTLKRDETLIILPFDKGINNAKEEILNRLKKLGLENLLFLEHINEICWRADGSEGKYIKTKKEVKKNIHKTRTAYKSSLGKQESTKEWLIFSKSVIFKNDSNMIEIAFCIDDKNFVKLPDTSSKLSSYFLTDKDTHLNFIVQAPFRTTTARDNLKDDDEKNIFLIAETSELIKQCILETKELGLLDIDFLCILPIVKEGFTENKIYMAFYRKVKETLMSGERFFPTGDGGFVSYKNAFLARGKKLTELLSTEHLSELFGTKSAKWLDSGITENKTPALREYLMKEIGIKEIDVERFSRNIDKKFLEKQSNDWMIKFYNFLIDNQKLWADYSSDPILRSKPIIRLDNGKQIVPFDSDGESQAYITTNEEKFDKHFNTVEKEICKDEGARVFLKKLGLRKPDKVETLKRRILPKYESYSISYVDGKKLIMGKIDSRKDASTVGKKTNKKHVKWIVNTLEGLESDKRKNELISELKKRAFLYAENLDGTKGEYRIPEDVYLGHRYTKDRTLETFYEDSDKIYFLSKRYKDVAGNDFLGHIGCKKDLIINARTRKRIVLKNHHSNHERSLDYFDPDSSIEDLENVLRNITLEKAKILWDLLKNNKNYKLIQGVIEKATRQDYSNARRIEKFSSLGKMLVDHKWIPDKNNRFYRPSDILLSDVHDELISQIPEEEILAKKLDFKEKVIVEILEKLPDKKKKYYEKMEEILRICPGDEVEKVLDNFLKKSKPRENQRNKHADEKKIKDGWRRELEPKKEFKGDNSQDKKWTGLNPEEEENIRDKYGKNITERLKNMHINKKVYTTQRTEIEDTIDPKEFLIEQYGGSCQICNTRIDVGSNKPYIETYRIFETRGENVWTNMEFNVLGLCPNCHARLKYGSGDLTEIMNLAEKISNNEVAPEPIEERNGDHYIVDISVVGLKKELFYTPQHMNKIAAFLTEYDVQ